MSDFKAKAVQMITGGLTTQLFTTATMVKWAHLGPHTSNTGVFFIGDSNTQQTIIRTGDQGVTVDMGRSDFMDASTVYVRTGATCNYAVMVYIERA